MGFGNKVREFHEAFGIPVRDAPGRPGLFEEALREALLEEEYAETVKAAQAGDLVELADGLADLVYIAYGTALAYGFDLDAVLAEVHRSNMTKLGEDGRPVYRADGKVLKGPGFEAPQIARVIGLEA